MGQSSSYQKVPTCDTGMRQTSKNEFELALDARAFEFHMLSGVKALRVSQLRLDGTWHTEMGDVYTDKRPFQNDYLKITPGKKVADLEILKSGVYYLYKSSMSSVKPILCRNGPGSSILYINMILRKQELKEGKYASLDEDILLLSPEGILIVNLPDETVRPTLTSLAERSFDPTLLAFASRPL